MRTLKDILEVPLEDLKEGIKLWADHSCNFWVAWLDKHNVSTAVKAGDEVEEKEEPKEEKPELPYELSVVIECNKAIVEKYQSSGAESLLGHLVLQLAKERNIKNLDDLADPDVEGVTVKDKLLEELKSVLAVSPEKQKLLKLQPHERAEHVATEIISGNADAIQKIKDGDKDIVKELDKKAIEAACGTVNETDLKFALRSMIQVELSKPVEEIEATDA